MAFEHLIDKSPYLLSAKEKLLKFTCKHGRLVDNVVGMLGLTRFWISPAWIMGRVLRRDEVKLSDVSLKK